MLKLLLCFLIALASVQATGEFVVLHSPESVIFHGDEVVEQSLLKEVMAASLGFTVKRGMWNGMSIRDPFGLPEAIVAIAVEGVDSLNIPKGHVFPLHVNEAEETTWQGLRECLEKRNSHSTLIRISLSDGLAALGQSSLGELKPTPIDEASYKSLSLKNEEDRGFIEEVQLLRAIASKIRDVHSADSKPDVFWLVVSGLRSVYDAHGKNSSAAREASALLNNALNTISEEFIEAYDGKVIIAAFTNDASQVRHTRSAILERHVRDTDDKANKTNNIESTSEAKRVSDSTEFNDNKISIQQDNDQDENTKVQDEEDTEKNIINTSESNSDISTSTANNDFRDDSEGTEKSDQDLTNTENYIDSNTQNIGQDDINISKKYSEDYPVIFNILLWFGVVFVFSLLAICIAIADMDPGRDSIIYRMTSNRMKKDN